MSSIEDHDAEQAERTAAAEAYQLTAGSLAIRAAVLDAFQDAEEMGGVEDGAEYIRLIDSLTAELNTRRAVVHARIRGANTIRMVLASRAPESPEQDRETAAAAAEYANINAAAEYAPSIAHPGPFTVELQEHRAAPHVLQMTTASRMTAEDHARTCHAHTAHHDEPPAWRVKDSRGIVLYAAHGHETEL
jgi:hypothetical protein